MLGYTEAECWPSTSGDHPPDDLELSLGKLRALLAGEARSLRVREALPPQAGTRDLGPVERRDRP
jgi:hypothetical protein